MSDRLTVSATFAVLMMSVYVLFGTEAARVPFTPEELQTPTAFTAPAGIYGQDQINDLLQ
ncbi:MAG: hypothetical protein KUG65_01500 [Sphingomonadaceae bacterium]|nr:hypothetical protein [Sphingomonadaceae bacterium]